MKVVRKHIPLAVRVRVAERQFWKRFPDKGYAAGSTLRSRLEFLLDAMFPGALVELHHRPALENRPLNRAKTDHVPPANDPDFLVYLLKDEEHHVETYVRGINGQLSDAGLRRKNKRMAKNRSPRRRPKAKIAQRKAAWPKRPFPKRIKR